MLSCILIVLAHWNNSPRVDMSPHSETLPWLHFLLYGACLAEKQQIPILVFGLSRSGLEPTIYSTIMGVILFIFQYFLWKNKNKLSYKNVIPRNLIKINYLVVLLYMSNWWSGRIFFLRHTWVSDHTDCDKMRKKNTTLSGVPKSNRKILDVKLIPLTHDSSLPGTYTSI